MVTYKKSELPLSKFNFFLKTKQLILVAQTFFLPVLKAEL